MNRLETKILTTRKNLNSLTDVPRKWIDRIRRRRSLDKAILDIDRSVSETYPHQERHESGLYRDSDKYPGFVCSPLPLFHFILEVYNRHIVEKIITKNPNGNIVLVHYCNPEPLIHGAEIEACLVSPQQFRRTVGVSFPI